MKKVILPVILLALLLAGCTGTTSTKTQPDTYQSESQLVEETQKKVTEAVPIPKLDTSEERKNVARRAELFNTENKLSYIYLVSSTGRVMAFYASTNGSCVASSKGFVPPSTDASGIASASASVSV
jgi:hypothetical protein